MLNYLHVQNLALIKDAEIDFHDGLNVMSGETGAGKSILLGAILLALGARSDAGMVRTGADSAFIELIFSVEKAESMEKLAALGITPEDGELILMRRVSEGKSVAKINGETVPVSLLRQVSELFIDVYGQHDARTLLSEENHLKVLDGFGKNTLSGPLSAYAEAYKNYKTVKEEASGLNENEEERERRMDYLRFAVTEISDASLSEGEEEEIKKKLKRIREQAKVLEGLTSVRDSLKESVSDGLSRVVSELRKLSAIDSRYGDYSLIASDADGLVSDLLSTVEAALLSLPGEAEEEDNLEERLNLIHALEHKYGDSAEAVLKTGEAYEAELQKLTDLSGKKERLLSALSAAKSRLLSAGRALHEARLTAARAFSEAVQKNLADLNFLSVRFEASVEETNRYARNGADNVTFLISMNPGEPMKKLSEVASGGELSRIMLAIKTLSVEESSEKTFLFDEVDQGISGRTAKAVGLKLRKIADRHQILLISHLPQIVALADHHYLIEKSATESETVTHVEALSPAESLSALARLLGTGEVTEAALQSARELKEMLKTAEEETE